MNSLVSPEHLWATFDKQALPTTPYLTRRIVLRRLTRTNKPDVCISLNALSGAVDILSDDEGRILERLATGHPVSSIPAVMRSFMKDLAANGYLFASREEEAKTYKQIVDHWTAKRLSESDLLVFFSLDTRCRMGCTYCFQRQAESQTLHLENSAMTPESTQHAFAALDEIQAMTGRSVKWVVLFGGEPLQEQFTDIVAQTISSAAARGHEIVAFSNLAMIGKRLHRTLAENAAKIGWIETTIDGPAATHNALRSLDSPYQRTMGNIQRLLDAGIPVTVRTNISPINIHQLPYLGTEFEALGLYEHRLFKHIVALCTDRHLQGGPTYTEDAGYSMFLALRDQHPILKKMQDYNIVYVLYHLAVSLKLRHIINGVDYRNDLRPVVVHCPTGAGSELVFTGAPRSDSEPGYSIYCCAECGSSLDANKPYRIGTYYPSLTFFAEQCAAWGSPDYLFSERSIRTVKGCYDCKLALLCGGACALESINLNGSASTPRCREAEDVVSRFLDAENDRLYEIAAQCVA